MADIFGAINDALTGKPQAQPNVGTGTKANVTGSFSDDAAIRRRNMAAQGRDYFGNPLPKAAPSGNAVSGIDTAMSAHADKLHPVKGR